MVELSYCVISGSEMLIYQIYTILYVINKYFISKGLFYWFSLSKERHRIRIRFITVEYWTYSEVVLLRYLFNFITMHAFYCTGIINLSGRFFSTVWTANIFHWEYRIHQTKSPAEDYWLFLWPSHCPEQTEQSSEPDYPLPPSRQESSALDITLDGIILTCLVSQMTV